MKIALTVLLWVAVTAPACAAALAPEIDGSLAIQFIALGGGLALLFKKKR